MNDHEPSQPGNAGESPQSACSRCGADIAPSDIDGGLAVSRNGHLLCPQCLDYLKERKRRRQADADADAPAESASLDRLATELHNLVRLLGSEKFSIWNILGGIAQAAALFAIVVAALDPGEVTKLLWAVLIQTMALSFFTAARK